LVGRMAEKVQIRHGNVSVSCHAREDTVGSGL
jgi:hypothetical protein